MESYLRYVLVISISLAPVIVVCREDGPQVVINSTTLIGVSTTTRNNRTIHEFRGIPFGKVTTRFKPPEKAELQEAVFDATKFGAVCPQATQTFRRIEFTEPDPEILKQTRGWNGTQNYESEDCLILNVYTPRVSNSSKLPVLVYFHGGSFMQGSSLVVQPGFFLDHDLVLVAPQYRLGPLGFLCLDTEDIPGNAGMLDQVLALEWIKDNINLFGGDPKKVTIAGNSAGAASVALLHLSPLATGLFHQLIEISGSAVNHWTIDKNSPISTLSIAEMAGCSMNEVNAVTKCLQEMNIADLLSAFQSYILTDLQQGGTGLGGSAPVIQKPEAVSKIFLDRHPAEIMKLGNFTKVPIITGVVKHEGTFIWEMIEQFFLSSVLNSDYIEKLLEILMISEPHSLVTSALEMMYFPNGVSGNITSIKNNLIDFLGTLYFKAPAIDTLRYFTDEKQDVTSYLYTFNHQDKINENEVRHASDLYYLFPRTVIELTEAEEKVSKKMVELFANFVISGNATQGSDNTLEWEPYTQNNPAYLLMDDEFLTRTRFEDQYKITIKEGLTGEASLKISSPYIMILGILCLFFQLCL